MYIYNMCVRTYVTDHTIGTCLYVCLIHPMIVYIVLSNNKIHRTKHNYIQHTQHIYPTNAIIVDLQPTQCVPLNHMMSGKYKIGFWMRFVLSHPFDCLSEKLHMFRIMKYPAVCVWDHHHPPLFLRPWLRTLVSSFLHNVTKLRSRLYVGRMYGHYKQTTSTYSSVRTDPWPLTYYIIVSIINSL